MIERESVGSAGEPRPWRSVAICLLVVAAIVAIGRDYAAAVDANATPAGMAARIATDPFRLALTGAAVAALLYGVLQLLGLREDGRALRRAELGPVGFAWRVVLRRLAGRPQGIGAGDWPPGEATISAGWGGDAIAGPLRLGVTAFPMVGFLGTVIGLSGAIEALPRAMDDEGALGEVLGSLHVAFDTTLLGLVGALVCLAGARAIDEAVDALARRTDAGQ